MERTLTKLAKAKARRAAPRGKFPPAPAAGTPPLAPARSATEAVDGVVPAATPAAAVNISVALMPVGSWDGSLRLAGSLPCSPFGLGWVGFGLVSLAYTGLWGSEPGVWGKLCASFSEFGTWASNRKVSHLRFLAPIRLRSDG